MSIYVKFTRTTHKIWSCHVTLASSSKKFYFSPNSISNFREVTKFGENWLKNTKVTGKKQIGGWKRPPTAYKVNMATSTYFDNTVVCSDIKLIFGTCVP